VANPEGIGTFEADPLSVLLYDGARRLLARAYANRGRWQGTLLADPSARTARMLMSVYGIDWRGKDNAVTLSGKRLNARDRYGRAFVRAVYYVNKPRNGGRGVPVQIEVGRRKPAFGVFPAGRAVRVRIGRGGSVRDRAVRRKDEDDRIWLDEGEPGGRWNPPDERDW
jgi:hypothetical protein